MTQDNKPLKEFFGNVAFGAAVIIVVSGAISFIAFPLWFSIKYHNDKWLYFYIIHLVALCWAIGADAKN